MILMVVITDKRQSISMTEMFHASISLTTTTTRQSIQRNTAVIFMEHGVRTTRQAYFQSSHLHAVPAQRVLLGVHLRGILTSESRNTIDGYY